MYYVGVDVGGTNLMAGLMNEDCEILDKASHPVITARPRSSCAGRSSGWQSRCASPGA